MTEHNQKLEPSRFDLDSATGKPAEQAPGTGPTASSRAPAGAATSTSQKPLVIALAILAVLAGVVFFWLPNLVSPPQLDTPATLESAPARKPPVTEASPWSDAQLERKRKDAQDVLALLLEEQFALEEMSAELWATDAFAEAVALATNGDELYRQQQFIEAGTEYQKGLEAMLALRASAPQVFAQHLEQGNAALAGNQAEAAVEALEVALLIQPDSQAATEAMARARTLPQVMQLLAQADSARSAQDLDQALGHIEQALTVDPEHELARSELAQARRDIARRDFNRAMTAGYQAMDQQDYDTAVKRFLAAQRILPAAGETEAALRQARNSRTRQQLEALQAMARQSERIESWSEALLAYQSILAIDSTVAFAQQGAQQAQTRVKLDKDMQLVIAGPERLVDERVYAETRQMLEFASNLQPMGPLLRQQIAQVSQALEQALIPIAVLLQSDEKTDITVYRVAHLGTFKRQQLELKPGTYTAVGVRNGYRDVRRQFTLSHDKATPVIDIACTDPI